MRGETGLTLKILVPLMLTLAGCGSSGGGDDHEHLEHFVPAHKPASYSALVEALTTRLAALETGGGDKAVAMQELSDIIGWIPELAADSNLRKADFDKAVAAGSQLAAVFALVKPAPDTINAARLPMEGPIAELKSLMAASEEKP